MLHECRCSICISFAPCSWLFSTLLFRFYGPRTLKILLLKLLPGTWDSSKEPLYTLNLNLLKRFETAAYNFKVSATFVLVPGECQVSEVLHEDAIQYTEKEIRRVRAWMERLARLNKAFLTNIIRLRGVNPIQLFD